MSNSNEPLLYLCDFTANATFNSGIQRVIRILSRALLELGVPLVPITLVGDEIAILSETELQGMAKWNGPSVAQWGSREELERNFSIATKSLIPELTTYYQEVNTTEIVINAMANKGISVTYIYYDAIPILFPQYYEHTRHIAYSRSMLKADLILPISKSAYRDLLNHTVIPESLPVNRIIPLSLPTENVDLHTAPTKVNTGRTMNMLFVSTIDPRKNHKLLLEATIIAKEKLSDMGINLETTLIAAIYHEHVRQELDPLIAASGARLIVNASDAELREQYAKADFTVYPSIYEGFGLPLVESFTFNTPVITSTGGSLGEVAADGGCLTFDPYDKDTLVSHIVTMASKKVIRDDLVEQIKSRPIKTWKTYAQEILNLIQ